MIQITAILALLGLTTAYTIVKIDSKVNANISFSPLWDSSTNSVFYIGDQGIVQYDFDKKKFNSLTVKGFDDEIPRFFIPFDTTKIVLGTLGELVLMSRKENSKRYIEDMIIASAKSKNMVFTSNGRCDTEGRLLVVSYDDKIKGQIILWKLVSGALIKVKTLGPMLHYEFTWNKEGDKIYFTSGYGNKTVIYEYDYNKQAGSVGAQRTLIEFDGTAVGINAATDGSLLIEDFFNPIIYKLNTTSLEMKEVIRIPNQERAYLQSVFVGDDLKQLFVLNGFSLQTSSPMDHYLIDDLDFQGVPLNKCDFSKML